MKRASLILLIFGLSFVAAQAQIDATKECRFNAYFNTGLDFNAHDVGPVLDISLGGRFTDYFYFGAEFGFHNLFRNVGATTNSGWNYHVPLAGHLRGYIPIDNSIFVVPNLSLGYAWFGGKYNNIYGAGFYCNAGAGMDIKHFTFGIGYMHFNHGHYGYFKIGARVGW